MRGIIVETVHAPSLHDMRTMSPRRLPEGASLSNPKCNLGRGNGTSRVVCRRHAISFAGGGNKEGKKVKVFTPRKTSSCQMPPSREEGHPHIRCPFTYPILYLVLVEALPNPYSVQLLHLYPILLGMSNNTEYVYFDFRLYLPSWRQVVDWTFLS